MGEFAVPSLGPPLTPGNVPIVPINHAKISSQTPFDRTLIEGCVRELVQVCFFCRILTAGPRAPRGRHVWHLPGVLRHWSLVDQTRQGQILVLPLVHGRPSFRGECSSLFFSSRHVVLMIGAAHVAPCIVQPRVHRRRCVAAGHASVFPGSRCPHASVSLSLTTTHRLVC